MPEKTNSAKRCPSVAQTIPEDPSDFLERYDWRRDQSFFSGVLFLLSHVGRGNCLSSRRRKSDFFSLACCRTAVYLFERKKFMSVRCFLICGLVVVAALAHA